MREIKKNETEETLNLWEELNTMFWIEETSELELNQNGEKKIPTQKYSTNLRLVAEEKNLFLVGDLFELDPYTAEDIPLGTKKLAVIDLKGDKIVAKPLIEDKEFYKRLVSELPPILNYENLAYDYDGVAVSLVDTTTGGEVEKLLERFLDKAIEKLPSVEIFRLYNALQEFQPTLSLIYPEALSVYEKLGIRRDPAEDITNYILNLTAKRALEVFESAKEWLA